MPRWPKEPIKEPIKKPIEKQVEITSTTSEIEIKPEIPNEIPIIIDELAPVLGESPERKRVREIYIAYRLKQPRDWNFHKKSLLEQLKKL